MSNQREVNPTTRKKLAAFRNALGLFQAIRQDMPASVIEVFIAVANGPGRTMVEYAKEVGTGNSTMSRQLRDLSDRDRFGNEGYQLLEVHGNATDTRAKNYYLTQKGQRLAEQIGALL